MSIRVVVAEDELATRKLILFKLSRAHGIELVGEAGDGDATIRVVRERQPDVLVLDNHMPGPSGLEIAQLLSTEFPKLGIVLHTMDRDAQTRARASGVFATLDKESPPEMLVALIREAAIR
ncbi:MAG TPA: response regulator transcription factor [Candidatus Dormibacteraeota bacterium]|jgi:DNA-binding NarL/FixJ family response regulator|nr:response regulator transcription factor [Candidatus Dormibacteraeota bacterium]